MKKIVFFVPENNCESVKQSMFRAGGGRLDNYDCCSFQVSGEGQFRPLKGSIATIGDIDKVERVKEFRVEMLCSSVLLTKVLKALKEAHCYECPAYEIYELYDDS